MASRCRRFEKTSRKGTKGAVAIVYVITFRVTDGGVSVGSPEGVSRAIGVKVDTSGQTEKNSYLGEVAYSKVISATGCLARWPL